MINVAICSTSPALRAGLRALLAADPDLAVVAASADPAELMGIEAEDAPGGAAHIDVIVATPERLAGLPAAPVLLITADPRGVEALRGMGLWSWGGLSPDAPAEALQAAIHALAEGLVVLSPELAQEQVDAPNERSAQSAGGLAGPGRDEAGDIVEPLTPRESDVLRCLADGMTNKQTALALGISEHTVKFHVSSIYSKMGVSNRAEAVRIGARRGWLPL